MNEIHLHCSLEKPGDRIVPVLEQHNRKVRVSGGEVPLALICCLELGEKSVWLLVKAGMGIHSHSDHSGENRTTEPTWIWHRPFRR